MDITALRSVSGPLWAIFLLRVDDRALGGLRVVALRLVDNILDGAGHGGFDFAAAK